MRLKWHDAYAVTPDGKRFRFRYTKRPRVGTSMAGFTVAKIAGDTFFLELPRA